MKRIGQLMEEMGFRKESSDSVKKAFLEHLIQSAQGFQGDQKNLSPSEKIPTTSSKSEQLAFDFLQDPPKKIG